MERQRTKIIYEPKGPAKEYAPRAANIYIGCTHGCRYCYAPLCMHKKKEAYFSGAKPRESFLREFERDCQILQGTSDPVLLSFVSDPYQDLERDLQLTRQAIELLNKYSLNYKILTKASLVVRDMDVISKTNAEVGMTIIFADDTIRSDWEPNASSVNARLSTLEAFHKAGFKTWLSLEPVIDPVQALKVLQLAAPFVDSIKIGKLNHDKERANLVDWAAFCESALELLRGYGGAVYFKDSLRPYLPQKTD